MDHHFSSEGYFCRAKSLFSSLFGIVLWASRLPLQTPKEFPTHHRQYLHLGLKTLIFSEAAKNPYNHPCIIHNHVASSSSPSSQLSASSIFLDGCTSWSSTAMDDLLGTDSGVCNVMSSSEEQKIRGLVKNKTTETTSSHVSTRIHAKRSKGCEKKREYPPPIPLLAQTGNLQGRMPWVLTRHYSDGKLVVIGEKVKHHEYFETRRENGHLILNLVPLDDNITCHDIYRNEDDVGNIKEKGEMEMELDLQFVAEGDHEIDDEAAEPKELKSDHGDDDDECDINNVDDEEITEDHVEKKAVATPELGYNSVPRSHLEIKLFRNAGGGHGMVENVEYSASFCNAPNIHEHTHTYFAHPASAPLCPLTTVM